MLATLGVELLCSLSCIQISWFVRINKSLVRITTTIDCNRRRLASRIIGRSPAGIRPGVWGFRLHRIQGEIRVQGFR